MSKDKEARYTDAVQNAFSEVKAWKLTTFVLGSLVAVLTLANVYGRLHAPAYLVPYNFATMNKQVAVEPGKYSPEYIQALAFQDSSLLLTWTVDTVSAQYERFLRRMTPELHSAQATKLLAEAQDNARANYTQSFYPSKDVRVTDTSMVIPGVLVRWQGSKEVIRQKLTYTLKYRESGEGLLLDEIDYK